MRLTAHPPQSSSEGCRRSCLSLAWCLCPEHAVSTRWTSCLPVSVQRRLCTTWGGAVISDVSRGDGRQQIHSRLTPSTLPLSTFPFPILGLLGPLRSHQTLPATPAFRPSLPHLPSQRTSVSTLNPPTALYHSVHFLLLSSRCCHRRNRGRGAHFPAMSLAPGTKSHAWSEQAEPPHENVRPGRWVRSRHALGGDTAIRAKVRCL